MSPSELTIPAAARLTPLPMSSSSTVPNATSQRWNSRSSTKATMTTAVNAAAQD